MTGYERSAVAATPEELGSHAQWPLITLLPGNRRV